MIFCSVRNIRNTISWFVASVFIVLSCKKNETPLLPKEEEEPYVFKVPKGWPTPIYNFENNPLSKEGFELGRRLFFEPKLSRTNTISCGTCHQPSAAFAQIGHDVSHGVDDLLGIRNSPALFNLNWNTSFFWDGGVNHIEVQPIAPINNPVEMDETLVNAVAKLNLDTTYKNAFKKVFNKEEVDVEGIMKSLAQFMGFLVSNNSKYDAVKDARTLTHFTVQEQRGYTLFIQNCGSCHTEPLFTDQLLHNNGLPLIVNRSNQIDLGRGVITPHDSSSYYKFKTPSLRNLQYTSPYMHDGRFATLEQVLDHYSSGNFNRINIATQLLQPIVMTSSERQDLLAFLNTLNDEKFVTDIRFQ